MPVYGTLTDTVVSGPGVFVGATGTLTGTVTAAGDTLPAGASQVRLSGRINIGG